MQETQSSRTFRAAPGRYYVGDPRHAISPQRWDEFLLALEDDCVFASLDGQKCLIFRTRNNGVFMDNEIRRYPVESGYMALVPGKLVENPRAEESGAILDMPQAFSCREVRTYRASPKSEDGKPGGGEPADGGFQASGASQKPGVFEEPRVLQFAHLYIVEAT